MKGHLRDWMEEKMLVLQGALVRKSEGMGTVEIILIIVYILTI